MKKLRFVVVLSLLLAGMLLLPLMAGAEENGVSGDNLTWTLSDAGLLTVSGSGSMIDKPGFPVEKVKKVKIESGVTSIGAYAFENAAALSDIILPDSVTSIGNYAFFQCAALKEINLPKALTTIGDSAFRASGVRSVQVPSKVKSLGSSAFYDCTGLEEIDLPAGLTRIPDYTFGNCSSLKEIRVPVGVVEIGEGAFIDCAALTDIEIPAGVTAISDSVFENCAALESVTLPDSVTIIGKKAFKNCTSLSSMSASEEIIAGLALDVSVFTLEEGATQQLTATLTVGDDTYINEFVTFASSDEAVATVDDTGLVTGVAPGQALIIVTGINDTEAIASVTVTEAAPKLIDISDATVASIKSQTYTGKAIKPAVTVKYDGKTLVKSTDYTVSYASNTNVGTATVTIKGKGAYTGSKKVTFKITAAKISGATVTAVADQTYTGKALKPAVTVKFGTKTLKKGTDYTVAYKNNKAVGKATITLTGKGNFKGTKSVTFKILPKGTTISKLTGASKKITITLKKQATQTSGYQIEYSTAKTFKSSKKVNITSTKTLSKTISSLKAKTTYYFRVRTYTKVGSTTYYSAWSAVKNVKTK
ncbi:MAG: leucine-rich repeat protein [Clostridia bacterium]|nr:leucine-rich repeat protein [Clostridia bacterium]